MGYTHYWVHKRNFTVPQWQEIVSDLKTIVDHARNVEGIVLADFNGDGGTSPQFGDDRIAFNGLGDDAHESFIVNRKVAPLKSHQSKDRRGWDFCKTERKPYDVVVTACLAYLSTVTRREDPATHEPIIGSEAFSVTSDGDGSNFLGGVDLVRAALPKVANQIDIPMDVMKSDRWCGPWVNDKAKGYEVNFCIDGHGYVLRPRTGESYRFETHADLANWLELTKRKTFARGGSTGWGSYGKVEENIWNAYGSFDKARNDRLGRAQKAALERLFPVPTEHAKQPPAFARPGEMPTNAGREFCYSVAELLNHLKVA
jgi:hypothetical protein